MGKVIHFRGIPESVQSTDIDTTAQEIHRREWARLFEEQYGELGWPRNHPGNAKMIFGEDMDD